METNSGICKSVSFVVGGVVPLPAKHLLRQFAQVVVPTAFSPDFTTKFFDLETSLSSPD